MGEPIGSVRVRNSTGRTELVLAGEVDMSLADELSAAVDEVLRLGRPIDVDVREVTFLDSSGLSKLVRLATSADSRPRLIEPPEFVSFLLEVTRLDEVMEVVPAQDGTGEPVPAGDAAPDDRRDAV